MAVAPLVPVAIRVTIRSLGKPLALLAGYLVLLGLARIASTFLRALFGGIESAVAIIPWVGGKVKGSIHRLEQRLTNYLGMLEARMASGVADALHGLATGVTDLAKSIEEAAVATAQIWWFVASRYSLPVLWYRVARGIATTAADRINLGNITQKVTYVTKVINYPANSRLGAAIKAAVRSVALELDGLQRWTIPRVRSLWRSVYGTIPRDIAAARARTGSITARLDAAWKWIRAHKNAVTATVAGAIAITMVRRLGGGWIFCRNWKRLGRGVCSAPAGDITALLGLMAFTLVAVDPKEVVREGQRIAGALDTILRETIDL